MRLYVVRHGLAVKNLEDRHGYSNISSSLAPGYFEALQQFALRLSQLVHFDSVYCSDFEAAKETAATIGKHQSLNPIISTSLRAINLGIVSGLSTNEIRRDFPLIADQLDRYEKGELHPRDFVIPGYESLEAFEARVRSLARAIGETRVENACIVAHRSIITMLVNVCRNCGRSVSQGTYERFDLQPLSVTLIDCSNTGDCLAVECIGQTLENLEARDIIFEGKNRTKTIPPE